LKRCLLADRGYGADWISELVRKQGAWRRFRRNEIARRKTQYERSRPPYRPDAGEPAVRGKNPFRRRVPLAGGARQKALPHARRRGGIRRAKRKPERAQARPVHWSCDRRTKADSDLVGRSAKISASDEMTRITVWALNPQISR